MMDAMTRDWARLGSMLKNAARVERGMEQQDVAEAIGVKRGALWNIEKGAIAKVTPTVMAYARLVGWADESVEAVLNGGDPVRCDPEPTAPSSEKAPEPAASDLSVLVQQALREGPLLESRVAEVNTPSGKVRATIVIRGEDGTPPEDLLAALRSLKIDVTTED